MAPTTDSGETPTQRRRRVGLSAFLTGVGVLHFVRPRFFDDIIPGWVPGPPRAWTYASGVAELTSAALLASPRTAKVGGYAAAATMVAVYPANIWLAVEHPPTTALGVGSWLRLPLQFPLIAWAARVARAATR